MTDKEKEKNDGHDLKVRINNVRKIIWLYFKTKK